MPHRIAQVGPFTEPRLDHPLAVQHVPFFERLAEGVRLRRHERRLAAPPGGVGGDQRDAHERELEDDCEPLRDVTHGIPPRT